MTVKKFSDYYQDKLYTCDVGVLFYKVIFESVDVLEVTYDEFCLLASFFGMQLGYDNGEYGILGIKLSFL